MEQNTVPGILLAAFAGLFVGSAAWPQDKILAIARRLVAGNDFGLK